MSRFTRRQPAARRRAISPGVGILIIAVGAILRFAVKAGSPLGLNVHIVGIILILAGVLGLLLPGSMRARLSPGWLRTRWVSPGEPQGYDDAPAVPISDARLEEITRDIVADVAELQDGGQFVSPDAPGRREDDL
jgi:hypothetical protein